MLSNRYKLIKIITLVFTEFICLFSGIVSVSLLYLQNIPLQYQMLGSFYSSMIMRDIGEWISVAKDSIEYFWIVISFVYILGKIIFVAVAAVLVSKKAFIGLIIPICIVLCIDIPAWLYTATHISNFYYGNLIGWAIAGTAIRMMIIFGYILIIKYRNSVKANTIQIIHDLVMPLGI